MSPALVLLLLAVAYAGYRVLRARRRSRAAASPRGGGRRRSVGMVAALLGAQLLLLAPPASASSCGEAPSPERPGAGMVGAIDPPSLDHGDPVKGFYGKYSYAGSNWNVYQPPETPCVPEATATIDTWAGNQLFNVGKNVVGATNALHYAMLSQDSMLAPLDNAVEKGAQTFYRNIYVQWFAVAALVLAVMLFRYIWNGDLASIGRRGLWALAGMWLAASVFALGGVYTAVDSMVIKTTSQIQGGFLTADQAQGQRHRLPNALYDHVIYTNWLRGEFGDPNSANAKKYGPRLLDDQAWTKTDVSSSNDQAKVKAKQEDYKSLDTKLGTDKGFFRGTDGSRTGAGFLGLFQGVAYALFQLLAKAAVLLAQVLIRVLVLAAPLIGLAAMVMPDLLRKVARAAGAVALTVLAFSAMAGAHALLLGQIFAPANGLSLIAQMLLAALVSGIFLLVGKPIKRMRQMVELSVGGSGLGAGAVGGGLFNRLRRGSGQDPAATTPQERFWSNVSSADGDTTPVDPRLRSRRARPEGAGGRAAATATRLDTDDGRRDAQSDGEQGGRSNGSPAAGAPARTALTTANTTRGAGGGGLPGYRGYTGATPAIAPAGSSRLSAAPPVTGAGGDSDDAVVVPSQVVTPSGAAARPPARAPRPADPEMVGGKPVYVLYRPSSGFETGDGHSARRR